MNCNTIAMPIGNTNAKFLNNIVARYTEEICYFISCHFIFHM